MDAQQTVSTVVRACMAFHGDVQEDVAKVLGLPRSSVAARLRGRSRWTVGEVEALANYWQLDMAVFFDLGKLGLLGNSVSRRVG